MRRTLFIGLLFLCCASPVLAQNRELAPGENLVVEGIPPALGGARAQLTFFPDAIRGAAYPPKGWDWFVFAKDSAAGMDYL